MIKITGGIFSSIQFKELDRKLVRTTSNRVRESIFNIINNKIENKIVLDAFGGSGIVSGEFISRKAKHVITVEINKNNCKNIRDNFEKLHVDNFEIINSDILFFLDKEQDIKFDFIYLDPPYENIELLNKVIEKIISKNLLMNEGQIIVETNKKIEYFDSNIYTIERIKNYGTINLLFLNYKK